MRGFGGCEWEWFARAERRQAGVVPFVLLCFVFMSLLTEQQHLSLLPVLEVFKRCTNEVLRDVA